jgi:hypothetical protein
MATTRNYLPNSSAIADDRAVLRALQDIPDYAPHNHAHATASLIEREGTLQQAELETERTRLAYEAARERQIVAAWDFHDDVTGAKTEVVAQFGANSQIVHAIGFKKKSERKRPVRR